MKMRRACTLLLSFLLFPLFLFCSESSQPSQNDDNTQYVVGELQNTPVNVPSGGLITIDGTLDETAWQTAYTAETANGGEILLTYSGGYLYIGLNTYNVPVATVFLYRENKVYLLHSSAAVGTAIYEYNGNGWTQIEDFTWRCRDGSSSQSAQEERSQFLADEGWLANICYSGSTAETEFQIAMPEESLLIAAAAMGEPNYNVLAFWPSNVTDTSRNIIMLQGPIPESAMFVPSQWMMINKPN